MKKFSLFERLQILVRGQLASFHESESTIAIGRGWWGTERDRQTYSRTEVLEDALEAWRLNPLGRRIVGLVTQYVVGGGVIFICKHEETQKFLKKFWEHPLNNMDVRIYDLCDELSRAGNLFLLLSTDADGMSYVRALPAGDVEEIVSAPNDIEQPRRFIIKSNSTAVDQVSFDAYDRKNDEQNEDGSFRQVVIQYAVNRPVGGQWGESDLAPVLKWLSRYTAWLEDRARLNRFRNAFMFVVKGNFNSEAERAARQATLAANPPSPGSIMVSDISEEWSVISPKLESMDAGVDGLALKKIIASGSVLPMHFLAEPESSTRTTAEAAGGPTFRHFEQRQRFFLWMIKDLLNTIVERKQKVDNHVSKNAEIEVRGSDISARDNVSLALAANNLMNVLETLRARGLIDNQELIRLAYRFMGEYIDIPEMIARAEKEGLQVIDLLKQELDKASVDQRQDQKTESGRKKIVPSSKIIDKDTGDLKPSAEGGNL